MPLYSSVRQQQHMFPQMNQTEQNGLNLCVLVDPLSNPSTEETFVTGCSMSTNQKNLLITE